MFFKSIKIIFFYLKLIIRLNKKLNKLERDCNTPIKNFLY